MAPPGESDLQLTIYGLDIHGGQEVDAGVFANKLKKLVSGLKRLDRDYNVSGQHKFMIHNLVFESATVMLREKVMKTRPTRVSPAQRFVEIGVAASSGEPFEPSNAADEYALNIYKSLSDGAGKSFSYGVVRTKEVEPVRLDGLLKSRVERIIASAVEAAENADPKYFRGVSFETYDGLLKVVDSRGLFPEAKLVLSAGGKEISCVVAQSDVEMLRKAFDRRVLVTGQAQHDGHSMLPSRIDVSSIDIVDQGINILEFRGSLRNADYNAIEALG